MLTHFFQSKNAVELCALLVDEIYGELASVSSPAVFICLRPEVFPASARLNKRTNLTNSIANYYNPTTSRPTSAPATRSPYSPYQAAAQTRLVGPHPTAPRLLHRKIRFYLLRSQQGGCLWPGSIRKDSGGSSKQIWQCGTGSDSQLVSYGSC